MTVEELKYQLEDYIRGEYGRSSQCLYASSDNCRIFRHQIKCVYNRNGEVCLQANCCDGCCNITIEYIIHCLNYFNYSDEVVFMDCDYESNYEFHNIIETGYDEEDDQFVIVCESRGDNVDTICFDWN